MKVYAVINAIQTALNKKGITKSHKNTMQGYDFRGIDDVYNALSPLMAKHGLCIFPRVLSRSMTERATTKGGTLFSVVIEAEFDFVCSEDQSKHTVKMYGEAMDSGDKATNKALSAAYKYACFQTFAIPIKGDNDADKSDQKVKATPQAMAARNAESMPAGMSVVSFVPVEVTFKDGTDKNGKPYTQYTVRDEVGDLMTTIDKTAGEIAIAAHSQGKRVKIAYERKGQYLNIKKIKFDEVPDSQPDPEPVIEEVPF